MIIRKPVSLRFVQCDVCGVDSNHGRETEKEAYLAAEGWVFEDCPRRDLCPKCAKQVRR